MSDIDKGVMVMDKYHLIKYISKAAGQMPDDINEVKGKLWKFRYKGRKKKFVKILEVVRKCAPNEKAVNECEEYMQNNWDSAVLQKHVRVQRGGTREPCVFRQDEFQTYGME